MTKVINSTPHPTVVKECICNSCGVTIEYVPIDVKSYSATDISGCSDEYHYIECPNCKNKIYVKRRW